MQQRPSRARSLTRAQVSVRARREFCEPSIATTNRWLLMSATAASQNQETKAPQSDKKRAASTKTMSPRNAQKAKQGTRQVVLVDGGLEEVAVAQERKKSVVSVKEQV